MAHIGLSPRLDRFDRGSKRIGGPLVGDFILQRFSERHEQGPVERTGSAANSHDEGCADAFQGFAKVLCGELIHRGQNSFKAAAHVDAVITVANGAIEIGQFVGAGDDTMRHRFKQQLASLTIDHHACPLNPSAPIRLPA